MSEYLILPEGVATNDISDGYHTFGELYDHRIALFLALMKCQSGQAWFSKKHDDGGSLGDHWFIAGIRLLDGDISYHLPISAWNLAVATGAEEMEFGHPWDGHTPEDVVGRLQEWVEL